uniref:Putative secreted protein n=1 Tax=Ixodes ricinus TaxID=34613 RepID=A0A6B0UHY5_IXORI
MRGPLRPILFLLTESMAFCGMPNLPSGPLTGVTSTTSHWIGTPAVLKISWTEAEISGPMPSPGMSVTVRTSVEACLFKAGPRVRLKKGAQIFLSPAGIFLRVRFTRIQ